MTSRGSQKARAARNGVIKKPSALHLRRLLGGPLGRLLGGVGDGSDSVYRGRTSLDASDSVLPGANQLGGLVGASGLKSGSGAREDRYEVPARAAPLENLLRGLKLPGMMCCLVFLQLPGMIGCLVLLQLPGMTCVLGVSAVASYDWLLGLSAVARYDMRGDAWLRTLCPQILSAALVKLSALHPAASSQAKSGCPHSRHDDGSLPQQPPHRPAQVQLHLHASRSGSSDNARFAGSVDWLLGVILMRGLPQASQRPEGCRRCLL